MAARYPGIMRLRPVSRGFTLVELMAVVSIVGILAVVGIMVWRQHVGLARGNEARSRIQAIVAAQERWRAVNQTYLDVSGDIESLYPMTTPGKTKYAWEQPGHLLYARWQLLDVTETGPVRYGYATTAGGAGTVPSQPSTASSMGWAAATQPWFVVQAVGDVDEDGVKARVVVASFNPEVYEENVGE